MVSAGLFKLQFLPREALLLPPFLKQDAPSVASKEANITGALTLWLILNCISDAAAAAPYPNRTRECCWRTKPRRPRAWPLQRWCKPC